MKPPTEGIHRNVPASEYHAWDCCSSSRLRTLDALTPAHLKHEMGQGELDTPATRIGTALHTLVLEGEERFRDEFAVGGPVNPKTGAEYGSETKAFAEWAESVGKPVLRTFDANTVRAMAKRINEHPAARGLLSLCRDRELSLVATLHGVRCKARLDALGEGLGVDIKTTSKGAGPRQFERFIGEYGLGLQAAFYGYIGMALALPVTDFAFVVVESEPPHCVACYRIDNHTICLFEGRIGKLLERYGECVASGEWPGWPDEIQEISAPAWLCRAMEREEEGALNG